MGQGIQFVQAATYPFRKENLTSGLLVSGLYMLGYMVVYIILYIGFYFVAIAGAIAGAAIFSNNESAGMVMIMLVVFGALLFFMIMNALLISPLAGYYWELVTVLREQGYDAPAPEWKGHFLQYWINGVKASGFLIILGVVLLLLVMLTMLGIELTMGMDTEAGELAASLVSLAFFGLELLLVPFVCAAFVQNHEEKRFWSLFNIGKMLQVGGTCFLNVVIAMIYSLLLIIAYIPILLLTSCTIVGLPFTATALHMSLIHLFTQAYDSYEDEYA